LSLSSEDLAGVRSVHSAGFLWRIAGSVLALAVLLGLPPATSTAASAVLLNQHLLVTWYGNPHSPQMGVLGESTGTARAAALRRQASAYEGLTDKRILAAYHLVAVVAQRTPGADGKYRRRESFDVIRSLLDEARAHGFTLVLDIQPGRSSIEEELAYLREFLAEPDVYLAWDPEYDLGEGQVPGRELGHSHAADVNAGLDFLERLIAERHLPPKVFIVHQFTLGMLPDKEKIRAGRSSIDLVLNMDGFGSQSLKRSSYRAVMRQRELEFAGMKLFYRQDTGLFTPEQVMRLTPVPSVVIYQ
jgi:hypothetical protein